mmetsp:Transcript_80988/g.127521  ORF Transcript_80988/g.127521 Transcript_80988/m.127521 type:complete len:656 (-) Transcript_80988:321-2288(-)|eukprot:CAMPEP_0169096724 /NCGR_PEP_ID=MMETSP1015-20121227/19147_1 /TAXON_ID=342587 /ORGANISM="Karlodinium micrum, Strain CCMP2283" /LENGTH=655 /DNA_ID=CAMNT_0009157499 /DNA_START=52 /DNA_END=2019 /DNA_ORIENTATION=+
MAPKIDSNDVSFSHVHAYCDSLKPLEEYKKLERKLNAFASQSSGGVEIGRKEWLELSTHHGDPVTGCVDPADWKAEKQDVVEQLMVGVGWRITGMHLGNSTKSFVVTSSDPTGVKYVFTAHHKKTMDGKALEEQEEPESKRRNVGDSVPDHFNSAHLERFGKHRAGRQGFSVLGFQVALGALEHIRQQYAEKHPKLLLPNTPFEYGGYKVLEVFAYYVGEKCESDADPGTLLRFIEVPQDNADAWVLPGIEKIDAEFDGISPGIYSDHWVSNVRSRTGFLETLDDTLGFTPKVDFNAGVVAAGEAQIESTVVGNNTGEVSEKEMSLKSQTQVYLPTNNYLSEVGHVYLYIKEIGQGIQHVAQRVADLPRLIQRANDMRKMTGAGLSFLQLPRSYYGFLRAERMSKDLNIDLSLAEQYVKSLQLAGVVSSMDIVELDATQKQVTAALPACVPTSVIDYVLRARYSNLYSLLRDHISEETYLACVRNNILVDVQGDDLLMQIFTTSVLQREAGHEAPFFEFIQRICSDKCDPTTGKPCPIKPGCGGFGIRNFLTLFLSIEVSKSLKLRAEAEAAGRLEDAKYFENMVASFTAQLEESNPILTQISDAMTAEGDALRRGAAEDAARWKEEKEKGSELLKDVSAKYNAKMKALRENRPA